MKKNKVKRSQLSFNSTFNTAVMNTGHMTISLLLEIFLFINQFIFATPTLALQNRVNIILETFFASKSKEEIVSKILSLEFLKLIQIDTIHKEIVFTPIINRIAIFNNQIFKCFNKIVAKIKIRNTMNPSIIPLRVVEKLFEF